MSNIRKILRAIEGKIGPSRSLERSINISTISNHIIQLDYADIVTKVGFSPWGPSFVAFSGYGGQFDFWNVERNQLINRIDCKSSLLASFSFSPNGDYAIGGTYEGMLIIFAMRVGGAPIGSHRAHTGCIRSVDYFPVAGTQYAVTTGDDAALKLWDLLASKLLRTFQGHIGYVRSAVFLLTVAISRLEGRYYHQIMECGVK